MAENAFFTGYAKEGKTEHLNFLCVATVIDRIMKVLVIQWSKITKIKERKKEPHAAPCKKYVYKN